MQGEHHGKKTQETVELKGMKELKQMKKTARRSTGRQVLTLMAASLVQSDAAVMEQALEPEQSLREVFLEEGTPASPDGRSSDNESENTSNRFSSDTSSSSSSSESAVTSSSEEIDPALMQEIPEDEGKETKEQKKLRHLELALAIQQSVEKETTEKGMNEMKQMKKTETEAQKDVGEAQLDGAVADHEPPALGEKTAEQELRAQEVEMLNMFQQMVWREKQAVTLRA
eukprot:Skav207454  [mRNA]  locus=scaffold3545:75820:80445:+ [translate_table: standard]